MSGQYKKKGNGDAIQQDDTSRKADEIFSVSFRMMTVHREDLERTLHEKIMEAGIDPEAFYRTLGTLLDATPDASRALINLSRFLDSGFSSSHLRDFSAHAVLLEIFLKLSGQSQYLADILVRNPAWFHWLTTSGELHKIKSVNDLRTEARRAVDVFDSPLRRRDALKRYHRREILRIGAADILGEASLSEVVDQLSSLAEAFIDLALEEAYRTVGNRPPEGSGLAVFGLGKLGGNELNFSSDIDLMFVYDADGDIDEPVGRIRTRYEYFVRIGEELIDVLSGFSDEGHLYRVDMRLRPDGRSGPLAMSRSAYMTYYEMRGAQWERQMLLKARCVGGDRTVGERFVEDLRPFVYRRTMISSPWQDIASMKRSIEVESRSDANIKLGSGGIRDIEFLVQGLQLVHGGTRQEIRTPNTLDALGRLAEHGLMERDESRALQDAYTFFRDIEHRLQLFHGLQTHVLPESDPEFELLGKKLGYGKRDFRRSLDRHRARTRAMFRHATEGMTLHADDQLRPEERSVMGHFPGRHQDKVPMALLRDIRRLPQPSVTARRISALLDTPGTRAIVTEAFRSKRLRADLVRALALSSFVYESLTTDPLLLETLIGQAGTLLGTAAHGWDELADEHASSFRKYNEVRSSVRFLARRSQPRSFEAELTVIAEMAVRAACTRIDLPDHMMVIGAGKLGSKEMGIRSDLDLILVFDEDHIESEDAQQIGKRFTAQFSGPARSYEVDHRLRPEGKNAPLVTGQKFLGEYLASRAEPWERLALMRSRPLWGSDDLQRAFLGLLRTSETPGAGELARYVRDMRKRMEAERDTKDGIDVKVGSGGIADIEFLAQTGQLLGQRKPGRPTHAVLRSLKTIGALRQRELHLLHDALLYLRSVESILRLNSSVSTSLLRPEGSAATSAAWYVGEKDESALFTRVQSRMGTVRRLFTTILDRWSKE